MLCEMSRSSPRNEGVPYFFVLSVPRLIQYRRRYLNRRDPLIRFRTARLEIPRVVQGSLDRLVESNRPVSKRVGRGSVSDCNRGTMHANFCSSPSTFAYLSRQGNLRVAENSSGWFREWTSGVVHAMPTAANQFYASRLRAPYELSTRTEWQSLRSRARKTLWLVIRG